MKQFGFSLMLTLVALACDKPQCPEGTVPTGPVHDCSGRLVYICLEPGRNAAPFECMGPWTEGTPKGDSASSPAEMRSFGSSNGQQPILRAIVEHLLEKARDAGFSEGTIEELRAVADTYDERCVGGCPTTMEQLGLSEQANLEVNRYWVNIGSRWEAQAAETTITESLRP